MKLQELIQHYSERLTQCYGQQLLPSHRKALDAMLACRSQCGEFYASCDDCATHQCLPLSCGHRSCPQCQHHLANAWLERQQDKLLPVTYFMVTFTIPRELRTLAWQHQSLVYDMLFKAAHETLLTVGRNNHGLELAMTAVLHTHKRDKGYHPHLHAVVPGGGLLVSERGRAWQSLSEQYLINEFALATVFRGIFLRLLFEHGLPLPYGIPKQWVTDVRNVGRGEKALKYLSRYLYRGVISENDILVDSNNKVTFRYRESQTQQLRTKTLAAETFLWKLLTHVLPRGFRRVRDYGFLHGNAKVKLKRIQLLLQVKLKRKKAKPKGMHCRKCEKPMHIDLVVPKKIPMRFRYSPPTFAHEPMS